MSDKAEDLGLELAAIVDADVAGVVDLQLAAKVRQANALLEKLQAVYSDWLIAVQTEIGRQEEARKATLESVGLGSSKASAGPKKRGPKSKKDSVAPEADEPETEVALDAE